MEYTVTIQGFIADSLFDPITWNNFIPKNNSWQKCNNLDLSDIIVYIDACKKIESSKFSILYLIESEYLLKVRHSDIIQYLNPNIVITFNKNLVDNKTIFYCPPPFQSWISSPGLYEKYKLCSFITSLKQMTPMQQYRVSLYEKYKNKIDCFGIHTNPIKNKLEGLEDYCFSFAIENDIVPGYFSEKILDCFMTGTVPIYMGHEDIKNTFDDRGIIFYDETFDIDQLSFDRYQHMLPYIESNYIKAQNINTSFDDYFLKGIYEYERIRTA